MPSNRCQITFASKISLYFKQFEDLQAEAVDHLLDMCESDDQGVCDVSPMAGSVLKSGTNSGNRWPHQHSVERHPVGPEQYRCSSSTARKLWVISSLPWKLSTQTSFG